MSRFRFYIKPFDTTGAYQDDFIDVTQDVISTKLGNISRKIDQDEYNVGIFKFNNMPLSLRNEHGEYSEADSLRSIFKFKRSDSLVKITWDLSNDGPYCGAAICGEEYLSEETEIFRGLLNDESAQTEIQVQDLRFSVLGMESIFDRVAFPYSSISNGDNISDIIYTALNQTEITTLLTVDALNISVGLDTAIDDKADLENKTVKEALDDLLFLSNAVLYIEGQTVYVSPRDAQGLVLKTYYGQSSNVGVENIEDISAIKTGINRTFNYWTWQDTALIRKDDTSIATHGVRKKEISSDIITNTTKRENILAELRDEFAFPKRELQLTTYLDYDFFNLGFFSKVNIDYPAIPFATGSDALPIYGLAVYGSSVYPSTLWTLVLSTVDEFKITGITIDIKKQNYTLSLRGV